MKNNDFFGVFLTVVVIPTMPKEVLLVLVLEVLEEGFLDEAVFPTVPGLGPNRASRLDPASLL